MACSGAPFGYCGSVIPFAVLVFPGSSKKVTGRSRKAGRDGRPASNCCEDMVVASGFDGIDALSVALGGPNLQTQFLLQLAADETSYAMGKPSSRAHDGPQRRSFGLLQQRDHFRRLGVVPPCRSRAAAGPVPRTSLVRRHLPPPC